MTGEGQKSRFQQIYSLAIIVAVVSGCGIISGCSKEKRALKLVQQLRRGDAVAQERAAQELVKIGQAALDSLIPTMQDPQVEVRLKTIWILGEIRNGRALESLLALLDDDNVAIRKAAVEALGKIGDKRAFDRLLPILEDKDRSVMYMVIWALGEIGDPRAVVPLIDKLSGKGSLLALIQSMEKLNSLSQKGDSQFSSSGLANMEQLEFEHVEVRSHAAAALGKIGRPAVAPLIDLLNKEDEADRLDDLSSYLKMRREIKDENPLDQLNAELDYMNRPDKLGDAVWALREIGGPAFEHLLEAMKRDAWKVAWVLGEIRDARAIGPLITAIRDSRVAKVRYHAAEALGKMGRQAIHPCIDLLADADEESRKYAVLALGLTRERSAVDSLIGAAKNAGKDVRTKIAEALGNIGGSRAADYLIQMLAKDEEYSVRSSAALALGKTADSGGVVQLVSSLMSDKDSDVRSSSATALGEIKDERGIKPLVSALRGNDSFLSEKTAQALVKIGAPSVEPLAEVLQDANPDVRQLAAWALGEIKTPGAEKILFSALAVKNLPVVAGAYRFFIRKGIAGSDQQLAGAISQFGTKEMAEDFLNCGNERLKNAARGWTKDHFYIEKKFPGKKGLKWGIDN